VNDLDQGDQPQDDADNPNEFANIGIAIEFVDRGYQIEEKRFLALVIRNAAAPTLQEGERAIVRHGDPVHP